MTTSNARRYEALFIIDNNRAMQAWDATVEAIAELLQKHGGEVVKTIKWEERKLAFEIKGQRRATYVLTYFDIDPESIAKLRRDIQISDFLLRGAIVRLVGEMLESPADLYNDGATAEPPAEASDGTPAPSPVVEAPGAEAEKKAAEPAGEKEEAKEDAKPEDAKPEEKKEASASADASE